MEVLFATSNRHKVLEANAVGRKFNVSFKQLGLGYAEVRDNSVSTVALEGIRAIYPRVKKPVIVEDSGLFINALNGFPGSYTRYAFEHIGIAGILRLMRGLKDSKAYFISAVAYYDGRRVRVFEGVAEGVIAKKAKGSGGFGFDPVFIPSGRRKTFAEDPSVKDALSHRSRSVELFCRWLMHK
jgi:XTP/dITP diphosphohydrolase